MSRLLHLLLIVATAASLGIHSSAQTGELPRSTPESEQVDPQAIINLIDSLGAMPDAELHHLMIVRHGKVIAEVHPTPFRAGDLHTLYSVSKTLTCLAVGIAVDRNLLRVSDRVATLLPDKMPAVILPELANITVEHLLTMSTGMKPTLDFSTASTDWLKSYFERPIDEQGRFRYDSMCTFALSAIVERVTGCSTLEFLRQNIFIPLGIREVDWESGAEGVTCGGYGLRLQAESMAKIGQLLLQKGEWEGRRLVSREWIELASQKHINYKEPGPKPTDTNQGYCYQMWRCLLPGAFRADGAYGQFIIVAPEQDMVLVMCGVSSNTRGELRHIWEMFAGVDREQRDGSAVPALDAKQRATRLPAVDGTRHGSPKRARRDITIGREHMKGVKREYQSVTLTPGDEYYTLTITTRDGEKQAFRLGYRQWLDTSPDIAPPYHNGAQPINLREIPGLTKGYTAAGCYAWTAKNTITCKIAWTNWIVTQTLEITLPATNREQASVTITENYP